MQACEVSAIQIREKDGTVFIKDEVCTGCGSCEKECPFGAIKFDSARRKAFKCDLCKGDPQCVRWCPTHSLGLRSLEDRMPGTTSFGWMGRLLRVNLTEKKCAVEPLGPLSKDFIGGIGIGSKIFFEEVGPEAGGLDPENKIILATGPLTGNLAPGAGKV